MGKYLIMFVVRFIFPAGLLLSIALRPFGISVIYLLLYLIAPLLSMPDNNKTYKGYSGRFIIISMVISTTMLIMHAVWHSALSFKHPYGSIMDDQIIKEIFFNLGFVIYHDIEVTTAVHYVAPELVSCVTSLLTFVTVKTGTSSGKEDSLAPMKDRKHQKYPIIIMVGKYLSLFLIMFSGILRPSVLSGLYFLVFLAIATVWSFGRSTNRVFAVVGRCLMPFLALHALVLLAYQWTALNTFYPPDMNFARYFGLTKIVSMDVTKANFQYLVVDDYKWGTLVSPLIILITYYVLGIETKELFKPKVRSKGMLSGLEAGKLNGSLIRGVSFRMSQKTATKEKWMNATNKVRVHDTLTAKMSDVLDLKPLLSTFRSSRTQRWSVRKKSVPFKQDSSGSIYLMSKDDASSSSIPPRYKFLEAMMTLIIDLFQVIVRSSYIATTITMMAWSILYHSWLTFVFLMWANVVWLKSDQRSFMLKTSPVLVFYAILLLLADYIYGMDLLETELPSHIENINLKQIGLSRDEGEPCVPLLVKSLFMCMFWLTLRQRMQELRQQRRDTIVSDLTSPFHLTASTAAASGPGAAGESGQESHLLTAVGAWLRKVCAMYWIYVVVIMLVVIGITGDRMTIFRIIYMFLFIVFILMFQISWHWWRRLMYVFWITVIIYSMINLIAIYIYQFDNCSVMIADYLYINERLQHDLGLDRFNPADLFLKLLTPTSFLIITIMQVHYFHKDFMAMSFTQTLIPKEGGGSSRPSQTVATMNQEISQLPTDRKSATNDDHSETDADHSLGLDSAPEDRSKHSFHRLSSRRSHRSFEPIIPEPTFRKWANKIWYIARRYLSNIVNHLCVYLEIHLFKIVYIALMLLCVMNVCAMHVPIIFLTVTALHFKSRRQQKICIIIISILVSTYLMAIMVYQIEYIKHSFFDVNCTQLNENNISVTKTYNNAEWVGFSKASKNVPLAVVLKGYIGLIALFTFKSMVEYRQQNLRKLGRLPSTKEHLVFPAVTRKEADIDIPHCLKYLINYGFYKFGVEVTLMCLMGVIGSRMDAMAVIYAAWLLILVYVKRSTLTRIWPVFTSCVTVLLPTQYLLAVGFLPELCMEYPWKGNYTQIQHIRNWLFLPYSDAPPHASKLIFDFFLLLFAVRQLFMFRIERFRGDDYPGGSNKEHIGSNWETNDFVNPVPDFLGYVGSWLDVVKRMIFLGMLWVTLAIMFLTGTNRVNLFSMGYLIGSFIFLWQGTDFYLRPKNAILSWWSWLLCYNVGVVVTKALLQIPGCMFTAVMQQHACWLVQLLGIGCVDKFAGGNIARFIRMDYTVKQQEACSVPQEDIGLAWDGVCFAFLILQRRFFHSYYFFRVIDESKATTVLASRGAELIEELRLKQMKTQEEQETQILVKIKLKMEKIKANQKKIKGMTGEPPHHDADVTDDLDRRRVYSKRCKGSRARFKPKSHTQAVRSGDYYMFEEFEEADLKEKEESSSDEEAPDKDLGIGKLLSSVIRTGDVKRAVSMRRASAPSMRSPNTPQSPNPASETSLPRSERQDGKSRASVQEPADPGLEQQMRGIDEIAPEPEEETWFTKFKMFIETVFAFVSSILVSITRHLMKFSRDYRYVSRTLSIEKKVLKETPGFGIGVRGGSQLIWEPLPNAVKQRRKLSEISVPEIRILAPSMERGLDIRSPSPVTPEPVASAPVAHEPVTQEPVAQESIEPEPIAPQPLLEDDDDVTHQESMFSLQTNASKNVSGLDEYEDSMFRQDRAPLVHLIYAFWYAILAHTDIVCYIMVFINQIQSATILSIPLPLMVFLWGTLTIPRPTKTFWVTLIAYTEVIVLIKSMFQFEILPWNQKMIPANMPFSAPRIIGIERQSDYALYDLLLLLIIFLHRFMLKSLGLWKESAAETKVHEDTEYPAQPEDIRMLSEGKAEEVGRKYIALHTDPSPSILPKKDQTPDKKSDESKKDKRVNISLPGPSKPPGEDDHFEVADEEVPMIAITTTIENTYDHFPGIILESFRRYLQPMSQFFKRVLVPGARVTADVYAYMFLCDFINFLVVIFGFAAFGTHQGDGGVQAYLEENKVPIAFLVMLILQFALIIVDRALYLRKFILGKLMFHYGLIIGVHIWMFFVLPFITERRFNALIPPPLWYMVKCIYLLLSAYQIRCGYPSRIIGNFLCKSYRIINMLLFRGFMAVPFVFELRTLMDWIWTDTSMTLMDWLKMEDIFACVYLLKCSRYVEDEYQQVRGAKKSPGSKYLLGGCVLVFIIAIIWFPLVFFAFGNRVGQANPPTDVTVKIRIGPFLPIFQMSAQSHNIDLYTEQDYTKLTNIYSRDRTAQTFLSNYMANDIAAITINPNSTLKWEISPPELDRLEREAVSNATLMIKFTYIITHVTNSAQNPPTIEEYREVALPAVTVNGTRHPERDTLLQLLAGNATADTWLNIPKLFPKFVKVFNKGTAKATHQLLPLLSNGQPSFFRDVQMRLEREKGSMYWRIHETCENQEEIVNLPLNNCEKLVMYTFNDKLFPETLNFISGSGIIGLYTTFVFLASRVLRGFFSGIYTRIMFDDLPNVDRVLQLCLDIYLVREALELTLEEDLFAKLVFLYRSPETMIKWSRPKDESEEQRALPPPPSTREPMNS